MKIKQFLFVILAILLVLSGCSKEVLEITEDELNTEVEKLMTQYAQMGQPIPENQISYVQEQLLTDMVDHRVLFKAAKRDGFLADDAEVDEEIENIKAQLGSEEDFNSQLEMMAMTVEDLRTLIFEGKSIEKLVASIEPKEVSDEDIKNFYDENSQYFVQPAQVQASHILISVDQNASEDDKAEALAEINDLAYQINNGADFAEIAMEHSTCPSSSQGGDLGFFGAGQMVAPFEEAAFALEIDQVSDVVETQFGYHIIKLTDKKDEGVTPLEEVSADIKGHLESTKQQDAQAEFLAAEKEKYTIKTPGLSTEEESADTEEHFEGDGHDH